MIQMCHQMSSNVIRCLIASLYVYVYLFTNSTVCIDRLPYMLFALIILLSNYMCLPLMSSPISVFSVHYLNEFTCFSNSLIIILKELSQNIYKTGSFTFNFCCLSFFQICCTFVKFSIYSKWNFMTCAFTTSWKEWFIKYKNQKIGFKNIT